MDTQTKTKKCNGLNRMILDMCDMLRPVSHITVAKAAEKHRKLNNPGAYSGDWMNSKVPYMVEPMNTFASADYKEMSFVGPAQCAKTDGLVLNTTAYSIKIDPMDMMIVCPTAHTARDFSIRRIDRMHQHSPDLGGELKGNRDSDNKFDKLYRSGMMLSISWPAVGELAGKPIPRVVLTDRDRMEDDIGGSAETPGDGEPFDLAAKRTTTFGSNAMCLAESSPSREVKDLRWIPSTPHEAPPCGGIIGLYNRGDKRRWYWPCPDCGKFFEGKFEMLKWPKDPSLSNTKKGELARMECPHCKMHIHPDERYNMNLMGMWLKDGQAIDDNWNVIGPDPRTRMASFWLRGVAAAFVKWSELVTIKLNADEHYEKTGDETQLIKFYNNDLGEPYYPKNASEVRVPETLKQRAEPLTPLKVPPGVRFLTAQIDTQKNSWAVLVEGVLPGAPYDSVVIERFDIRKSERLDADGERYMVRPATYLDDWNLITEHVINRKYELDDGSGREMAIYAVSCDLGGEAGVTSRAYDYYRRLRDGWTDSDGVMHPGGLHARFTLVKGDPLPNQPRVRVSYPDAQRKDIKAAARGDVPILLFNSNLLKDDLNARLDCMEPTKGMYRTPDYLDIKFYNELCVEVRVPDKGWQNPKNERNENWDLSYYGIGLRLSPYVKIDKINWENPPSYAAEWDKNTLVSSSEKDSHVANNVESENAFTKLARALA